MPLHPNLSYGNDIIYNKDMDWEQYVRTAEHSLVEVYGNDQYWQAYVKKEIDRLDGQRTIKPLINVFD